MLLPALRRHVAVLVGLLTILALSPTAALADDGLAIGSVGVASGEALRTAPGFDAPVATEVGAGSEVVIADGPLTAADGSLWYQVSVWGQFGYLPTYAVSGAATEVAAEPALAWEETETDQTEPATTEETWDDGPDWTESTDATESTDEWVTSDAAAEAEAAPATGRRGGGGGGGGSGQAIADFAMGFVGYPYVYAGASPSGFDCSGFTMYVVGQTLGIDITHDMFTQVSMGTPVDMGSLQPGDLVFFQNTFQPGLSHAGIYVGGGQFVHAENESTGVKVSDINSDYYASRWYGAVRLA
ncbi:MAG: C40 family peptidase [Chloroflexota bacterium]|nr:C40 family peptidase [Chloroflexota bacterium]